MNSNETDNKKTFSFLRIVHILFLVSIPIYISVIFSIKFYDFPLPFEVSVRSLYVIEAVLAFFAIYDLLLGYYWPKILRKFRTTNKPKISIFSIHLHRIANFVAIAIYGLVLAILGSAWYIWIWFFVVSVAALVLTFPTDERLNCWTQNQPPTE